MLNHCIVFIHNIYPHTVNVTTFFMDFTWEQFDNYFLQPRLCLHIKSFLDKQNFNEDDKVKELLTHA